MLNTIDKLIRYIGYLSGFVVGILVLLIVYDATLRYLFAGGSIALQELQWYLFDVMMLFGIVYTMREKGHVRIDIFHASYPKKTKLLIDIISSLFFVLPFSLFIIYISIDFVMLSFTQHEVSSNPGGLGYRYLIKALIPLSFTLLVLQALKESIENFKDWKSL